MTIQQIAGRLIELCREGEFETAQKELYADHAVSIEPYAMPGFEIETKGLPAIFGKGRVFGSMLEAAHGITVSEPLLTANSIAFVLTMDMTMKGRPRQASAELCVYEVKDGKIVSEHFFI